MTKIYNTDHFKNALKNSRQSKSIRTSLFRCLKTLNRIKRNYGPDSELHLGPDFVPHSFTFAVLDKDNRHRMHGGLILHGFGETFAVEVNPQNGPHYSIHT